MYVLPILEIYTLFGSFPRLYGDDHLRPGTIDALAQAFCLSLIFHAEHRALPILIKILKSLRGMLMSGVFQFHIPQCFYYT